VEWVCPTGIRSRFSAFGLGVAVELREVLLAPVAVGDEAAEFHEFLHIAGGADVARHLRASAPTKTKVGVPRTAAPGQIPFR